jgi:C-terminal processing protease CtpA/Prc
MEQPGNARKDFAERRSRSEITFIYKTGTLAFNRAGTLLDGTSEGRKVMTVFPGSPADTTGIAIGDVATLINGYVPATS